MNVRQYVFGPVPSRRLGSSLGVDLVPYKTCSHDCIYCELGRTTCLTVERKEYVPVAEVLAELEARLEEETSIDYVTLAGSGEPTLHSGIGEVIDGIKRLTPLPVAVLTNGSLLADPVVREELAAADLIVPSLDAGDEMTFQRVNRPHPSISFERMVDGLREFAAGFRGRIWIEVFLLSGITDTATEADKIAHLIAGIKLERVQLNTVDRPPVEPTALPVPWNELNALASLFPAPTDLLGGPRRKVFPHASSCSGGETEILALLARRSCRVEDIASGLGLHRQEAFKMVETLVATGKVHAVRQQDDLFYMIGQR
jgi:wyosine [tRNA(Phe)-imidazoG37] synthetase (radical SAM superfamily)